MRKISAIIPVVNILVLFFASSGFAGDDSGTFRGKWWNYYERGLGSEENGDRQKVIEDLKKAISMRAKDQRMARTYGMHFIEYFPHRELGIAYLTGGEIDQAITELEESLRDEESAKAVFYLNRARKTRLQDKKGSAIAPPVITFSAPRGGETIKNLAVKVGGKATGDGLVSKIVINGEPYRFDLARSEIDFKQEVQLSDGENRIVVVCEDLTGNRSERTILVSVDREGPVITVSEIKAEEKNGERFVKITGEVNDATGIRKVSIGDRILQADGKKNYAFDIAIEEKKAVDKLIIGASDILDNDTEGAIDIAKDLTAFGRKPKPILLAFNAAGILSFDKERPSLKLREPGEAQQVFIDRYFVEGEAFDNKKVEKIAINGQEISSGKGKKVFFGKMIKLKRGDNRIVVEAFDAAGNRAVSELLVKREIPAVMQLGSRLAFTVLPFESRQRSADYALLAYDYLIGAFVDQKRFNVLERAKLEQVLLEQKLTKAKLSDPEHSLRIGRLMSANAIVSTSVKEGPKSVEIVSRIINTETSEVMDVKDVFTEDKNTSAAKELMDGLAAKIARDFPLVEGIVINKEHGVLYSDIGSRSKIRKDAGIIVYRKGKEIKHPITGKSLGFDTIKLGEGRVEDVQEDFSKIKLVGKGGSHEINVKDFVITK